VFYFDGAKIQYLECDFPFVRMMGLLGSIILSFSYQK